MFFGESHNSRRGSFKGNFGDQITKLSFLHRQPMMDWFKATKNTNLQKYEWRGGGIMIILLFSLLLPRIIKKRTFKTIEYLALYELNKKCFEIRSPWLEAWSVSVSASWLYLCLFWWWWGFLVLSSSTNCLQSSTTAKRKFRKSLMPMPMPMWSSWLYLRLFKGFLFFLGLIIYSS